MLEHNFLCGSRKLLMLPHDFKCENFEHFVIALDVFQRCVHV